MKIQCSALFVFHFLLVSAAFAADPAKPNILWIIAEDLGVDMGVYGTKGVHTPHLDTLASEGALYTRAYTTASICAPSRSSFMTGVYPHQVDAEGMRSLVRKPLPEGIQVFTEYLRDAGYSVGLCNNGKKDWGFAMPKKDPYDTDDWGLLSSKVPFFCQYQFYDTHRVNKTRPDGTPMPFEDCPEHPVDRKLVELPPDIPDTPEARVEQASYLENVNKLDMKVGELIADVKTKGLYESTIIVFMGDNGPALFRGKGFIYERGIRMPLIVRIPKAIDPTFVPGVRKDEFVSALDLAPTFVSLAGAKVPGHMQGRIFLGPGMQPAPEFLFAVRDRMGTVVDRVRGVFSHRFKYIRNDIRGLTPYETSHHNVAASKVGLKLFKEGKLSGAHAAFYEEKPAEELYDLENDPFEMRNLASDASHGNTLGLLKTELDAWIKRTNDTGELDDPKLVGQIEENREELIRKRKERAAKGKE